MTDLVLRSIGVSAQAHMQTTKLGIGKPLGRVVSQQVLRAELIADLAKRAVELLQRTRIVILAPRVLRELDQRMLAAGVAAGARFYWHDDQAVDDCFRF